MDKAYEDDKILTLAKAHGFAQFFRLKKIVNLFDSTINNFINNEIISNDISFDRNILKIFFPATTNLILFLALHSQFLLFLICFLFEHYVMDSNTTLSKCSSSISKIKSYRTHFFKRSSFSHFKKIINNT